MRIIAKRTLVNFYTIHAAARSGLESWFEEVSDCEWSKPSDVIITYPTADAITGKRFVFNIKGNRYRLVADIEFKFSIVFLVWVGTHANYTKINIREIKYDKTN